MQGPASSAHGVGRCGDRRSGLVELQGADCPEDAQSRIQGARFGARRGRLEGCCLLPAGHGDRAQIRGPEREALIFLSIRCPQG